jgi:hypothetical protein
MVGYSGTPLAAKLGIKAGSRLMLLSAPEAFSLDLPAHVEVRRQLRGEADVIVAFFTALRNLDERLPKLGSTMFPSGSLWIAWPKKASGMSTDLDDNVVRGAGLRLGLVDNKVCAIDQTWSGLRFVWRLKDRSGPPPRLAS